MNDRPKSIAELDRKVRLGRGRKKALWTEISEQLSVKFGKLFQAKHVGRKWQTLVDGYKKAVQNNSTIGQAPSRFAWLKEMEEIIGSRHDVNFTVTATQYGITVHRDDESEQSELPDNIPNSNNKASSKKRKHDSSSDVEKMLKYMREADDKAAAVEEQILHELSQMTSCLKALVDKM